MYDPSAVQHEGWVQRAHLAQWVNLLQLGRGKIVLGVTFVRLDVVFQSKLTQVRNVSSACYFEWRLARRPELSMPDPSRGLSSRDTPLPRATRYAETESD